MDRERAYNDYAAAQMSSEFLDKTFKLLHFTIEQRKFFCENSREFRYGDTPQKCKPHFVHFTSIGFNAGVFHSLYAALEEVRERRGRLAKVNDTNIFDQAKLNSEVCVRSIVGTNFPKLKVDNVRAKRAVDEYIQRKHSAYFGTSYDITIPVTWARTVGDKNIATVDDGRLTHLVLQAKERKLDRLNGEDIKAYKCLSMTGNNGNPQLHDTWVMHWRNDTTSITALSTEFSKAEKLLRRRIKKAVTDVLLDL
jgi:hypothetical protein